MKLELNMTREGIVAELERERIYMTYNFNYPHESLQRIVEVVPIFRYQNGMMLSIEVDVYKKIWENLHDLSTCISLSQNTKFIIYCMTTWQKRKNWTILYSKFTRN
jgi:hypothetical protein